MQSELADMPSKPSVVLPLCLPFPSVLQAKCIQNGADFPQTFRRASVCPSVTFRYCSQINRKRPTRAPRAHTPQPNPQPEARQPDLHDHTRTKYVELGSFLPASFRCCFRFLPLCKETLTETGSFFGLLPVSFR